MGSTDKYPHGLNHWVENDIPLMEDFNGDNHLLDSSTMWKANYDPEGTIASEGIAAYVMRQINDAISAQNDTIHELQVQLSALSARATTLEGQIEDLTTRVEALEHPA